MGWNRETLAFKKEFVVLGTEETGWNSTAADEQDASLVQKNEASEPVGHVEAVAQLHVDSRKSGALWLMTSKSIARIPGPRRKSGELQENETSGRDVRGQNETHLRKNGWRYHSTMMTGPV